MYQSKVSVNYAEEKSVFGKVSYWYLFNFNFNFNLIFTQVGGVGVGAYLRWSSNSRLGAYSNKYGMS